MIETGSSSSSSSAENRSRREKHAKLLGEWKQNVQPLLSTEDTNLKSFRFACQRAVNTPVNAISAASSAHLKDKLVKLKTLLSGGQAPLFGDKTVCASGHPLGIPFCKNLLAKQFVNQGAEVVSSKPDYAFSMAAVLTAIWVEFPDFGDLFLAHLYEACPYLVPCQINLEDYDTAEAGYKAKGYKYNKAGTLLCPQGIFWTWGGQLRPPRGRQRQGRL